MKNSTALILGAFGVVLSALITTVPGQALLAIMTTWVYELVAGESIWQTLWNNPMSILEFIF